MKTSSFLRVAAGSVLGCAMLSSQAASLTWDANTGTTGAQDGSGSWTTNTTTWWNGAANTNWVNLTPDTAIFGAGGVGGIVTVTVPVTVTGMTFTSVTTTNYYTLTGSNITLSGSALVVHTNATINNILAGSVGLTKTGSATLTLGAANTYSGGTRIDAGIVQANASGALGTDVIAISNAGIRLSLANNVTLTNAIVIGPNAGASGAGLIMVSAGTGTVSGPIQINNGAAAGGHFAAPANSRLRVTGAITSSVAVQSRAGNVVFSGGGNYAQFIHGADTVAIAANNGLSTNAYMTVAASAAGVFDLSGFNQTLTGITNVNASSRITSSGAGVPSILTLNVPANTHYGFGGTMDLNLGLVKAGQGTQTFSNAGSAYTGDVTVAEGTLRITAASTTTNTALGSRRGARTITVQTNAALRMDINNFFGGTGLTAAGLPRVTLNGGSMISTRYGAIGNVTMNGGLLTQSSTDAAGYEGYQLLGTVTVGGGSPSTIDSGNGKGSHVNTGAGTTFDVADVTGSTAVDLFVNSPLRSSSGDYAGAGHLVKTGVGTMLLAASNTFSGTMAVNGGTLAVGPTGSVALATGITVAAGAVLDLSALPMPYVLPSPQSIGGSGLVTGSLSVANASRVIAGGIGSIGTLTVQGDLNLQATTTNYFDLTNSLTAGAGINDLINVGGILTANGQPVIINPTAPLISGSYRLFNYGSTTNDLVFGPLVGNTSRDSWTIDTNTSGQVNLQVNAGTAQLLQWLGRVDGNWDGGVTNWFSLTSATDERFYDVDTVLFDDTGATVNTVTVTGVVKPAQIIVSAESNYTVQGTGRFSDGFGANAPVLKSGGGTLSLFLTNDFTGGVTVNAGYVLAGANAAFGTGPLLLAGGGIGAAVDGLVLANAAQLNAGAASIDTKNFALRMNGVISGTSTVTKTGTGALTLTAANTYTGTTVVSKGTVQVLNNAGLGNSSVILGDAGTGTDPVSLLIGNQRTLARPITVSAQAGGAVTIGHDAGPGTGAVATVYSGLITLERDVTLDSGNQTDRLSFDGVITGTGNVTVVGTKRITLGGTNNFVGNVSISGSNTILQTFAAAGSLPDTASVAVGTDSVFQINVSDAIDALTGSGFVQPVAANPTLTIGSAGGSGTFSGIVRNNGANFLNITKVGAGTETFSGAHTATGATVLVNAGTLAVGAGGSVTSHSVVAVSSGAVFDVTASGPHLLLAGRTLRGGGTVSGSVVATASGRLVPGTGGVGGTIEQLTISGDVGLNATSTNYFNLTGTTNVGVPYNDLVTIGGNLEPSGSVVRIDYSEPLASGSYRLMTYAGSKTTTFNTNVDGNVTRKTWALDETSVPGQINLVVAGGYGDLRWTPLVSSNWNSSESNWVDVVALTTNAFLTWDSVLFDDLGAYSNGIVNLGVTVTPARVAVNASSNYSVTGVGRITGLTGVTKDGSGTFTLGTANDFTGDVVISNGTLKAGSTTALGSTAGVTRVVGGTLDVNGLNLGQEVIQISGTGFGGNGTIVNSGAAQINALQYVKLLGDATVGGSNRFDIRSGAAAYLDQAGFTLTKVGPGSFNLVAANVTNGGNIIVNGGMLSLETTSAVREPGTIYANTGTVVQFYQATTAVSKPIAASNATLLCAAAGTIASPISIDGVVKFDTSGGAFGLTNVISGGGMLVKTNANTLNLTGNSTYTGGTLVVGGELQIGNSTDAGSIVGIITNNASVYFYRTNAVTMSSPIYGTGSVYLRTRDGITIDSNSPIAIGGNFNVGQNFPARLILTNGASVVATNTINISQAGSAYVEIHSNSTLTTMSELLVGNNASNGLYFGDISQFGGTVNVLGTGTGEYGMRLGHWPGEVSFYRMSGGTLNVTNAGSGTSALYIGIDGIGILDLQGGTINAKQIFVDGRGNTLTMRGTNEQLIVAGGRINIGSGGLQTAGSGEVYLGGGTLSALTNWTSATTNNLITQLTGSNGNTTVDTAGFNITLAVGMSGTGGLVKTGSGQLTLSGANTFLGGVLVSNGTVLVNSNGVIANNAANFVTVRSGGKFTLNKVNVIANGHGTLCQTPISLEGGTLELLGDSENRLGAINLNAGTVLLNGGDAGGIWGALYLPEPITVSGSAPSVITNTTAAFSTIGLGSNTLFTVPDVTGNAAVDLACYAPLLNQPSTFGAGGFTKVGAGTMASFGTNSLSGRVVVSNGTLLINGLSGGTGGVYVATGATLGGAGSVSGEVAVDGILAPGATTGILAVATYTQSVSATLAIELGGTIPGVDHDRLDVVGNAALDGTLQVALVNGFSPTTNDTFLIVNAGSLSGGFATTNLPALSPGLAWDVSVLGGAIVLTAVAAGGPPATGYDLASQSITNPADRGYQTDADGDGYANLLEYATGGDMTNIDTIARVGGARTNGLLALRFNRNTNAVDATIIVEGSDSAVNGATWLGIATNSNGSWGSATNVLSSGTNSPLSETVFDTLGGTNRFLRLRVVRP